MTRQRHFLPNFGPDGTAAALSSLFGIVTLVTLGEWSALLAVITCDQM